MAESKKKASENAIAHQRDRPEWSNSIEFLMSCIATSVGLGNVWRFPFTAYENGGGAFLIPYLIVLFLIGKPLYYLEMHLGQFTSHSSVKIYDFCPGFRGIGVGQIIATICVITYYTSLIALTLFFMISSFTAELPWATCREEWGPDCVNATLRSFVNITPEITTYAAKSFSSSELYFLQIVLKEKNDISDGIGYPDWKLTLCLLGAWCVTFLCIVRGVKSSGKAAYFLALFPYVIIIILLVHACTLEGAVNGILFFLKPQWDQLLNAKVWKEAIVQLFFSLGVGMGSIVMFSFYNDFNHNIYREFYLVRWHNVVNARELDKRAVKVLIAGTLISECFSAQCNDELKVWHAATTQLFFSLSVGMGTIPMFASYNKFSHNIYRDAMIVTTLDTFTSLMAGLTIFAILGNLAHNLGVENIGEVVKSGTGLAFISYPDAIAKFEVVPQVFAVMFFFMLFVLGVGSVVALQSAVVTVICDQFYWKHWKVVIVTCCCGFVLGLVYLTPGGQWMLNLVDFYGGTLLIFTLAIFETTGVFWIYGLENFCWDLEFMTKRKISLYWRTCWLVVTPILMTLIFLYSMITIKPVKYSGWDYPISLTAFGWAIFAIGMFQFPLWGVWIVAHKSKLSIWNAIKEVLKPNNKWGPADPQTALEWQTFKTEAKDRRMKEAQLKAHSYWKQKLFIFLGKYR